MTSSAPSKSFFSASIPLKPQDKPLDFPRNFDKIVYEEYIVRYLESISVAPSKLNVERLKREFPIEQCKMTVAWKSRGWNSDSVSVVPIGTVAKKVATIHVPDTGQLHSNIMSENSIFVDTLDKLVAGAPAMVAKSSLAEYTIPTSHFAPNFHDLAHTDLADLQINDIIVFGSHVPLVLPPAVLHLQTSFLKDFIFDHARITVSDKEIKMASQIFTSNETCLLLCFVCHYVYWVVFGNRLRTPIPSKVLSELYVHIQMLYYDISLQLKSFKKHYTLFFLPLFLDSVNATLFV